MDRREMEDHDMICGNVECNKIYGVSLSRYTRKQLFSRELKLENLELCEYKQAECKKCRKFLFRYELTVGITIDCGPEELLQCPIGCECPETGQINKITRNNLLDHLRNDCANVLTDCPFKDHGCFAEGERRHIDKHVQDDMAAHMMLLAKQCSSLNSGNLSLAEQIIVSLTKENRLLKEELKRFKKNEELSRTYSWKIRNYDLISRVHSSIRSSTFPLRGYNWYLRLFPVENELISVHLCLDKGPCFIFPDDTLLVNDTDISALCRLTVKSQRSFMKDLSSEKIHVFYSTRTCSWDTTLKWQGFMGAYDPLYCVDEEGSLTINCMIQVDHKRKNEDTVLIEKTETSSFSTILFFVLEMISKCIGCCCSVGKFVLTFLFLVVVHHFITEAFAL